MNTVTIVLPDAFDTLMRSSTGMHDAPIDEDARRGYLCGALLTMFVLYAAKGFDGAEACALQIQELNQSGLVS